MSGPLVFALPGNEALGARLAEALGGERGMTCIRHFPDGESYVRLATPPRGREVILACTLDRPDERLMPLLLAAAAARDLGAARVGLVAPYHAYLRQDARFHDGEAVSARYVTALLSRAVDWVATVDPHLHRLGALGALYAIPAVAAHAAPAMGRWIAEHVAAPVIVGPDEESAQWARAVADAADAPCLVLRKARRGDRDVSVSIPDLHAHRDRTPVLVDDIVSTARTMIETVRHAREAGARAPVCVAVHAVFAPGALEALRAASPRAIISCNTIPHETNAIDVVPAVLDAVRPLLAA